MPVNHSYLLVKIISYFLVVTSDRRMIGAGVSDAGIVECEVIVTLEDGRWEGGTDS